MRLVPVVSKDPKACSDVHDSTHGVAGGFKGACKQLNGISLNTRHAKQVIYQWAGLSAYRATPGWAHYEMEEKSLVRQWSCQASCWVSVVTPQSVCTRLLERIRRPDESWAGRSFIKHRMHTPSTHFFNNWWVCMIYSQCAFQLSFDTVIHTRQHLISLGEGCNFLKAA